MITNDSIIPLRIVDGMHEGKKIFIGDMDITSLVKDLRFSIGGNGRSLATIEINFEHVDITTDPNAMSLYTYVTKIPKDEKPSLGYRFRQSLAEAKAQFKATFKEPLQFVIVPQYFRSTKEIRFNPPKNSPQEFADLVEESFSKKHSND